MNVVTEWYKRSFSDPQIVILLLVLVFSFMVFYTLGKILAPVFTAIVIAYLLMGPIRTFERLGLHYSISVGVVYLIFLALMVFILVWLLPVLWEQAKEFVPALPETIGQLKLNLEAWFAKLEKKMPTANTKQLISQTIDSINNYLNEVSKAIVTKTFSFESWKQLLYVVVFIFLMPLLVFFFLKDRSKLFGWMKSYLPKDIQLTSTVWKELNIQIANYIRGKVFEILVVWIATYIAFLLFGLKYALLLSALVGFSVVIPYIGVVVVTIPVVLIAYFQFYTGSPTTFWAVIAVYTVIQVIDGVVIVPLLFSEVVKLHPIAIVIAILVFGGIWGFWGVFFAIPLASLVQAILHAWPRQPAPEAEVEDTGATTG